MYHLGHNCCLTFGSLTKCSLYSDLQVIKYMPETDWIANGKLVTLFWLSRGLLVINWAKDISTLNLLLFVFWKYLKTYCYVNSACYIPLTAELQQHGNFCSCATPCDEILYVPSLSFSAITSNNDMLQGEDLQEMNLMRDNLIKAREVTYR